MKNSKSKSNYKTYIALFTVCIITVVLSSAFVINKRNNNKTGSEFKTMQTSYKFGNSYTSDEIPKYISMLPILADENNNTDNVNQVNNDNDDNKNEIVETSTASMETNENNEMQINENSSINNDISISNSSTPDTQIIEEPIVYDGLTINQLNEKINKSLNSNVSGYGYLFGAYALEKGVDPYIATAIMLHETGCKWTCSYLVINNNNVGGIKGSSGTYKTFDTLENGIKAYIDNLSNGYFSKGLNTPETIMRKYTGFENLNWLEKVNNYINDVKAQ